jgi:hypothetical protein
MDTVERETEEMRTHMLKRIYQLTKTLQSATIGDVAKGLDRLDLTELYELAEHIKVIRGFINNC